MTIARRSAPTEVFDIKNQSLKAVLDDIHRGRIRLPLFHRDWCWPSDHIRSLLESFAEGHPIGSPTFVPATSPDHRAFDGAAPVADPSASPLNLVLDGQQRLTAAYQACYRAAPVRIRSGESPEYRFYFYNMRKAVLSGIPVKESIFSIATRPDGTPLYGGGINYTDPFVQYERGIFPTNLVFDFDAYQRAYSEFWDEKEPGLMRSESLRAVRDFRSVIVASFEFYKIPVQMLRRPMQPAALCRVYETLNSFDVACAAPI
ncbi:DUF262 domain-containing protein [Tardiphaga sp. P9-11]|uniref:DUF262 domain-containing protein n=1 Tax=Tardiphaga sp. P9-11 TaxID=2024614 RepID=UPI0011F25FDF|nr:DUF262 domain-containing protein [Tardiphaga sp. P9-11]KAA0073067.1 DUF262 domain-containing protein [Tardiphaga sp. P9-11]